jgi:hypothetical protein
MMARLAKRRDISGAAESVSGRARLAREGEMNKDFQLIPDAFYLPMTRDRELKKQ